MASALIALGSNLGDRASLIEAAVQQISSQPRFRLIASSSVVQTRPVGGSPGQELFFNAAVKIETNWSPREVLQALLNIEDAMGRARAERWGPRNIDLDLLLFDEQVIRQPEISVPHPRMAFRRFVLAPAAEIADTMLHPTTGWTVRDLLLNLDRRPNFVIVCGVDPGASQDFARRLADTCGGRLVAGRGHSVIDALCQTTQEPLLEILHEYRSLLDQITVANDELIIADFWPAELRVAARLVSGDADTAPPAHLLSRHALMVPQPKLIVFLDDDDPLLAKRICQQRADPQFANRVQSYISGLRIESSQRLIGPVLHLNVRHSNALEEAQAALAAMQ